MSRLGCSQDHAIAGQSGAPAAHGGRTRLIAASSDAQSVGEESRKGAYLAPRSRAFCEGVALHRGMSNVRAVHVEGLTAASIAGADQGRRHKCWIALSARTGPLCGRRRGFTSIGLNPSPAGVDRRDNSTYLSPGDPTPRRHSSGG
jgi:hypothetical protein